MPGQASRKLTRREMLVGAGTALVGVGALSAAGLAYPPVRHRLHELLDGSGTTSAQATPDVYPTQTPRPAGMTWPWTYSPANPVLNIAPGWDAWAVYDCCVLAREDGSLWMWYSTRGPLPSSIGLAVDATGTGDHWVRAATDPVLKPEPPESYAYGAITRPSVVRTADGFRMWYSTVGNPTPAGISWIGTATSPDGNAWQKHGSPVLTARDPWEKQALQCPNVIYDAQAQLYRMWYSGGDQYEPDAVGYATSLDGIAWTRHPANPIFVPTTGWEDYKVGSFQVRRVGDWYYAFYNAFQRQPFVSRVGMARSRDGITGWERHPANPLFSPGPPGSWNARMIYKPTALWSTRNQRWDVWFNASAILNHEERIGHAWSNRIW